MTPGTGCGRPRARGRRPGARHRARGGAARAGGARAASCSSRARAAGRTSRRGPRPCSRGAIRPGALDEARALLDAARRRRARPARRRSAAGCSARSATTSPARSSRSRSSRATTSGCRPSSSPRSTRCTRSTASATSCGSSRAPSASCAGCATGSSACAPWRAPAGARRRAARHAVRALPRARRARARPHRARRRLRGQLHAAPRGQLLRARSISTRRLRESAPVPYNLYLDAGGWQLVGATPETFLRVGADGRCETRPIKGTRPRDDDPAVDAALAADLATHPKDRAENVMIVDLARNDLSRVCLPGHRARAVAVRGRVAPDRAPARLDRDRPARARPRRARPRRGRLRAGLDDRRPQGARDAADRAARAGAPRPVRRRLRLARPRRRVRPGRRDPHGRGHPRPRATCTSAAPSWPTRTPPRSTRSRSSRRARSRRARSEHRPVAGPVPPQTAARPVPIDTRRECHLPHYDADFPIKASRTATRCRGRCLIAQRPAAAGLSRGRAARRIATRDRPARRMWRGRERHSPRASRPTESADAASARAGGLADTPPAL